MRPMGLLKASGMQNFFAFSSKHLLRVLLVDPSVSMTKAEGVVAALSHPVASQPSGLTAFGEPLLTDTENDKEGVLHVFSVLQCERKKTASESPLLEWSRPMHRHWLCRTVVGDTKQTTDQKESTNFGDNDKVVGGAVSDAICELLKDELIGYVPFRIVRCPGSSLCAISYRRALCSSKGSGLDVSLDAILIAFVDYSGSSSETTIDVLRARDVAFLPTQEGKDPHGVLLSFDGTTLTYFDWYTAERKCSLGSGYRPILGVEIGKDDFVDCRRLFAFSGAGKVVFAAVGTRPRDNRICVVIGELCDAETICDDNWSELIPNIVTDRSCWLEKDEEVITMIGLEGDDSGYRNFAVCTSARVLILSSALTISAESKCPEPCNALAPLGPFAVGFHCRNKLHYLCCLDGHLANGVMCTLPLQKHGYSRHQLMSIRPDRFVLYHNHSGTRCVEFGQNSNAFLLPAASTWPALLLEPLIANAVCVGGKDNQSTPVLRSVIEKFGRKIASITHGENEGIGHHGAGMTSRVFEILGRYGLKHASTWLLTGTVQFERSTNSRILPTWLPVNFKSLGGFTSDAFLHLISNGDQYFADYIKSPDENMAAPLPRQSDPSVYLCREYARSALQQGKGGDALKLLDLVGSDATESTIVQLALMLEKGGKGDAGNLLKLISGYNDNAFARSTAPAKASSSLTALSVFLKETKGRETPMSADQINRWMKPLAPSIQRGGPNRRLRQKLVGEKVLFEVAGKEPADADPLWVAPCSEAKHVWYVVELFASTCLCHCSAYSCFLQLLPIFKKGTRDLAKKKKIC